MEFIRGMHNIRESHRNCIATIGNFDGVHTGHQMILHHIRDKARELALPSLLICFEPQPEEFFDVARAPARLTRLREKVQLVRGHGIDRILCLRFNERTRRMSAEDFISLLVRDLGVHYLVVGDDWKFGYDRTGDFAMLQCAGKDHGFQVTRRNTITYDDVRVSSTRIRECLAEGNFALAEQLLGRPYTISGRVVYGREIGRQLGTPTANLQLHRYRAPVEGVFAVEVDGLARRYQGVANCGVRPTIGRDTVRPVLEVHLFDFTGDIYGCHLEVIFRHRIRPERKFAGLDALSQAIRQDIREARELLARSE